MEGRSPTNAAGERVYHAIKARAMAYAFPQGRRIYLQPLADDLGVSTTPVREALNRLAAEDLVIKAPRKGFFAKTLSLEELRSYYRHSRLLLTTELNGLAEGTVQGLAQFEPIATVLHKLTRRIIADVNVLAAYSGEILYDIASIRRDVHVMRAIGQANDQLYCIRTFECRAFGNVQDELRLLCELVLAAKRDELLSALHRYHDIRIAALPGLVELAAR